MSLKSRLLILVLSLLSIVIFAISLSLTLTSREGTRLQTENDGLLIAQLLARSAGVLDKIPEDVEDMIGQQMLAQANFAAHMVALAEGPAVSPEKIIEHFKEIISKTVLSEVTITDTKGEAYIQTSPTPLPFVFQEKSKYNPRSNAFFPLLKGRQKRIIQESFIRDYDEKLFKYVGVAGIDKPRIVQVGFDLSFLNDLRQRVGFQRLVEGLLKSDSVNAIWIVNKNLETLAYGSCPKFPHIEKTPSEIELDFLEKVVNKAEVFSVFHDGLLKVMAPIYGKNNTVVGATILQLPTNSLQTTLSKQLQLTGLFAFFFFLIGGTLTYIMAKRLSYPVTQIAKAAKDIEAGSFNPDTLDDITERDDELGHLAAVFQKMGIEVQVREERLDALVKVRTKDLEQKTSDLQKALDKLKTTQAQLIAKEKMASLGQLTSGIAHELKNPLNFVINFSQVTVDITKELFEAFKKENLEFSSETKGLIDDIQQNIKRVYDYGKNAEEIINVMIQHARPDGGDPIPVDFNPFLTKAVEIWDTQRKGKNLNLDIKFNYDLDKTVTQVKLITQDINRVVFYLLDNSYYAISEKKKINPSFIPEFSITTERMDQFVGIHIRDNGIGIPESIINKVFNPFFTTKPTRQGSTGMGLSLSYDIVVQEHGGSLTLTSKENEYTEVFFKLPIDLESQTNA